MNRLLEILFRNPILLFVVAAWLIGMISNAAKARRKQQQRRKAQTRMEPVPEPANRPTQASPPATRSKPAPAKAPTQSPDEIAREMRRILGLEPEPKKPPAPPPPAEPVPVPVRVERAPPRTNQSPEQRSLALHAEPHVGEQIRDRHLRESRVGKPSSTRGAVGELGGRTQAKRHTKARRSRYALEDLGRVIVMNEILSPPVSLRPFEERLP